MLRLGKSLLRCYVFEKKILRTLSRSIDMKLNYCWRNATVLSSIPSKGVSHNIKNFSQNSKFVTNINDLVSYIETENRVPLKQFTNLLNTIDFENLTEAQIILLLECCGKNVPNLDLKSRNDACQRIYNELLKHNNLTLNIYHTYVKICTENGVALNHDIFLSSMKCKPTQQTYKILLNNVCEKGDILQIVDLLHIMKSLEIPANEFVFNDLVLAHAIQGGLSAAETVLQTMRAAQIPETDLTYFSLLKGIAQRGNGEFEKAFTKYPVVFQEGQFIQILEKLGLREYHQDIIKVIENFAENSSREFILKIDYLCIHLIHMGHPEAAMLIYKRLIKPVPERKFAHFLLREMLLCNTPVEKIIKAAREIKEANLNALCLENTTEIVLRLKLFDVAPRFFEHLPNLRPHFFWPLLVDGLRRNGEAGIVQVLEQMSSFGVQINTDTLEYYVLPFLNLHEPKLVIQKLQNFGLTLREIIGSIVVVLLRKDQLELAHVICKTYNTPVENPKIVKLLTLMLKTKSTEQIVGILQRICESQATESDVVGDFLVKTFKECKSKIDIQHFMNLLKEINKEKLKLTSTNVDILSNLIDSKVRDVHLVEEINRLIETLQDFTMNIDQQQIPHPSTMNIEELECHLIELKNKKMETRGVIRRLILKYCGVGNQRRVQELRDEFIAMGYKDSSGMKAAIMYSYVQGGYLEHALEMYKDVKRSDSKFRIDHFKLLDLAHLMVSEKSYASAIDVLREHSGFGAVRGGAEIVRNCWKLLGAYEDEIEQMKMFDFLVENGYCKASNVILGPLLRIHLNKGNVEKAVERFVHYANVYCCTPLQLEILMAVLDVRNTELMKKVLEATENVHGKSGASIGLISALAEKGLEKPLCEFLTTNGQIALKLLPRRYERWINEGKVEALHTLANVFRNIKGDSSLVHISIMKCYSLKNDCTGALNFYEKLVQTETYISRELETELISLLKRCKYEVPKQLNIVST